MRLLPVIALMGAFVLGCVNSSAEPIPEGQSYPTVVGKGTFIEFDSRGGDCSYCMLIVYTGDDGLLRQRVFYVNSDNNRRTSAPDAVTIPKPVYPGNKIVITRTGDSAYTVSKEE